MSVSLTCFPWLVLHQCACFFRFFGNARRRLGGSRAGRRGGKKKRFAVRLSEQPCRAPCRPRPPPGPSCPRSRRRHPSCPSPQEEDPAPGRRRETRLAAAREAARTPTRLAPERLREAEVRGQGVRGGRNERGGKTPPLARPSCPSADRSGTKALVRGWGRELQIQTLSSPADSARLHVHRPSANDLPRRRGRRLRSPAKPGPPLGPRRGPSTGGPPISAVALSARRRFRKGAPTKWIPLFSL